MTVSRKVIAFMWEGALLSGALPPEAGQEAADAIEATLPNSFTAANNGVVPDVRVLESIELRYEVLGAGEPDRELEQDARRYNPRRFVR